MTLSIRGWSASWLPTVSALFLVCACRGPQSDPASTAPDLILPARHHWQDIFFRTIDETTTELGIPRLRDRRLADGDLEIRVWSGFGPHTPAATAFRLRRESNNWQGSFISARRDPIQLPECDASRCGGAPRHRPGRYVVARANTPCCRLLAGAPASEVPSVSRSGWDTLWQRLRAENVLSLKDGDSIRGKFDYLDGRSVVLEVNEAGAWRAGLYSNPEKQPSELSEFRHVATIVKVLGEDVIPMRAATDD